MLGAQARHASRAQKERSDIQKHDLLRDPIDTFMSSKPTLIALISVSKLLDEDQQQSSSVSFLIIILFTNHSHTQLHSNHHFFPDTIATLVTGMHYPSIIMLYHLLLYI